MSNSKFLSDSGWKDISSKNKIKDNGLIKVLADYKRLPDDKHDEVLRSLDEILKLAGQLKKAKDVAAASAASKYVAEVIDAAEADRRVALKAKAEADKDKAKAEAEKKAKPKEDDDEEEEESSALLTTKMIPLLKAVKRGEMMHTMVASAGKQTVVLMSRKPITPARRKLLADELGVSGGIRYSVGHCVNENGATTFVLKTQVAGMAKRLKMALLQQTSMRFPKLSCRGEDGETDDDLEEMEEGGGDGADEGHDGASNGDRGGDAKAQSPELARAPQVWEGTRELLQGNISALKKAVQAQVAGEGGGLVDDVNGQLEKLDRILGKLDQGLSRSLKTAGEAPDASGRTKALGESKGILADYIRYVASEPLIDHLDNNPFGVKTDLKATLSKSLTQLARAIG